MRNRTYGMLGLGVVLVLIFALAPGAGLPAPAPAEVGFNTFDDWRNAPFSEHCGGLSDGTNQTCSVTFAERAAAAVFVLYCTTSCPEAYRTTGIVENFVTDPTLKGHAHYIRSYAGGEGQLCTEYSYKAPNAFTRMDGSTRAGDLDGCKVGVQGKWGVAVDLVGGTDR